MLYFIVNDINRVIPLVGALIRVSEQIDPGYGAVWVGVLEAFVAIRHGGGC